jgi:predicted dehydrogenase
MSDDLQRRDFLKGAAATLAALLSERGLNAARLPPAAQDEFKGQPVACALIGAGVWGRELLATMSRVPSLTIATICDSYAPSLKRAINAAPKAATAADYREVLSSSAVEAVVIATPSHLHKNIALAALDAGKHVYCEAPLAASIDDARAIAEGAAKTPKLIFQSGLQGRSNALWKHVRNFVRTGVLGDAALVKTQWNRKDSWRRAAPTPEREQALNWRLQKATSGGLPAEIGIHQIDLVTMFLNAPPTAVSGTGAVIAWRDGREVPDTVTCAFEYPRNVRATFSATLASSFGGASNVFQGSNASLYVRDTRAWLIKEADSPLLGWEVHARKESVQDETGIALIANATKLLGDGKEPGKEGPVEPEHDAVYLAMDNFARSVRGKARPAATAADGLVATVVALKAHDATLEGGRVELNPELLRVDAAKKE